jgi:hypothetical protein
MFAAASDDALIAKDGAVIVRTAFGGRLGCQPRTAVDGLDRQLGVGCPRQQDRDQLGNVRRGGPRHPPSHTPMASAF